MTQVPLSLALVDFLPVLFTIIGFVYLIRLVSFVLPGQGRIAFLGGGLVVAGGFFKAIWKLFMAFSYGGLNVHWMEDGMFVFMAPGYVLFAWSIWQAARSVRDQRVFHVFLPPLVFIVSTLGTSWYLAGSQPDSPAWERVLLTVTVLATFGSGILLIIFAFRQRLALAGGLFLLNLIGILVLNGLARLSEQTLSTQWIEEGINTVSWLSFALAARQLYYYARERFGLKTVIDPQLAAAE